MMLTVGKFIFFITIRSGFVFVHSNGSVSVTIQKWTHVHMNFLFSQ